MSAENPLWGAPRVHGELLKLGFEVAQSSVAKYMVKRCGPPSQGWRTFLRNHASDIVTVVLQREVTCDQRKHYQRRPLLTLCANNKHADHDYHPRR